MAYTATIEEENKEIAKRYKDMLSETYQTLSVADKKMIRKAFEVAADGTSRGWYFGPGGLVLSDYWYQFLDLHLDFYKCFFIIYVAFLL